jgi:chorismate synthase
MLTYITAGESHGKSLIALIEDFPAGLKIDIGGIERDLILRSKAYGRSVRQEKEKNRARILSGLRRGLTIGSPIIIQIDNAFSDIDEIEPSAVPRPGHAEFAGALKYLTHDVKNISERASARETAARVAAGSLAKQLLKEFGIDVLGYVIQIGIVTSKRCTLDSIEAARRARDASPVYALDISAEAQMAGAIDSASASGDSVGGVVEMISRGVVPGLGSHTQWTRKLDGRIAVALMSVQAVKGVEFGAGFLAATLTGSQYVDEMRIEGGAVTRGSNNAGGIEGGISNGEDIIVRCAVKPVPTTKKSGQSVNLNTGEEASARYERSDVCAVAAAAIICESVLSFEIASALCEKFGSDSLEEMRSNWRTYLKAIRRFWKKV